MRRACRGLLLLAALVPAAGHAQSLIDFYRQALQSNPTLRSRNFGIEQARARQDIDGSRLRPQVEGSSYYSKNDYRESGQAGQSYGGSRNVLQARQVLVDFANYFRLQSAQYAVTQSEQQHAAAQMALGGDVVDRYLAVLQASDEITHLQAEKTSVEAQLKRLRFMRERGLVKVTDLFETEAYYHGLLTREIEARNTRAVALERLREITGLAAQQVAPLAREQFPAVPGEEAQWVRDAARNNPNLTALEKAMDVVYSQVKSARAEHWPVLSAEASKTWSDQGYDNRIIPSYNVGVIGLRLTIPLYAGGRVTATEREANARFEIARETLEGARREVERDARTAYLTTQSSYARIGSTNAEVQALERTLQAQQKSHEMGVSTVVDVLNAQRLLLKSRSEQSRARYDYIRGLTTLRVHAGALSQRDIEEMDGWMVRQGQAREQAVNASPQRETAGTFGLAYLGYGPRARDGVAEAARQALPAPHGWQPGAYAADAAQTPLLANPSGAWAGAQRLTAGIAPLAQRYAAFPYAEHAALLVSAQQTAGRCMAPFDRVYLR